MYDTVAHLPFMCFTAEVSDKRTRMHTHASLAGLAHQVSPEGHRKATAGPWPRCGSAPEPGSLRKQGTWRGLLAGWLAGCGVRSTENAVCRRVEIAWVRATC